MSEWSAEKVERVIALRDQGLSASAIGRVLGVTRNAVCGVFYRLGVPKLTADEHSLRVKEGMRNLAPRSTVRKPPTIVAVEPPEALPSAHIGILALTDNTCRYPVGDVGTPDFGFCGRIPRHHSPYCDEHHSRCFVPLSPRHRAASESGGIARNARALEDVA